MATLLHRFMGYGSQKWIMVPQREKKRETGHHIKTGQNNEDVSFLLSLCLFFAVLFQSVSSRRGKWQKKCAVDQDATGSMH